MITALIVCAALLLDARLGEPRRFHPLVGFATWAQRLEKWLYRDAILAGLAAILCTLLPFMALSIAAVWLPMNWAMITLDIVVLYLAIGWNSLNSHAEQVRVALTAGDLIAARQKVGLIVSRHTDDLSEQGVSAAAIESVLENGNDAVFGAIFWFVVAGLPGVVLYRLVNTLDAMWGYRNSRYLRFGRVAARLDDVLNWFPARLTALSYALVGKSGQALRCWWEQGAAWKSANAGSVMAAGAGSLGLELGGAAVYDGSVQPRALLGAGRPSQAADIGAAQQLVRRALLLWVLVLLMGGWLVDFLF
jgi:adenosylcobinamide-phosphate synthase